MRGAMNMFLPMTYVSVLAVICYTADSTSLNYKLTVREKCFDSAEVAHAAKTAHPVTSVQMCSALCSHVNDVSFVYNESAHMCSIFQRALEERTAPCHTPVIYGLKVIAIRML
ncbi:hypothetical protein DPMN_024510 [Dreissena polymorpha]|uniref:Apple domain-containing protein n=1 Tax=Dreissena polymorpha TaxID=45954 RepID=A0A9D4LN26_DREPO|nr:hypothetical protein DPMN_024510 [Dreissena polymorpha]